MHDADEHSDESGGSSMAVPHNKQALLDAIHKQFDKLYEELRTIPEASTHNATMEGHVKDTYMSVCDLVAYLIGWNELVLKWITKKDAGEPVDFPETGFKWNELGRLAQKFYQDYAGIPYPELLVRLVSAKEAIVVLIEARSNTVLYEVPWYEKWTMGRMIQFNTASPYDNARGRVRKWLKIQSMIHT
jgi:hypothetical protein